MATAAMVAALLTVTGGGVWLGSVIISRHRAQAAADLAALAAAEQLPAGAGIACGRAESLAGRMGAGHVGCRIDGLDVVITVEVPVALAGLGAGPARAVARAGPA